MTILILFLRNFSKYNIRINRVAGHGVFITGDEFSIRRAMKSLFASTVFGNKVIREASDNRIKRGRPGTLD